MARGLTYRQRRFVALYRGNATEAARLAGYTGDDPTLGVTGHELLKNPKVAEALKNRDEGKLKPYIADRLERQRLWTAVLRDKGADMKDRLKAAELLGKSEADFIDRVQHGVEKSFADMVMASLKKPEKA